MTKRLFRTTLPVCVFVALLAAFLFVSPAFAQDEIPPEAVPTALPVESTPTESAAIEVAPTDVATQSEPVEELFAEPTTEEAIPAELYLAEQLNDAGVVITDGSGEPVTLAARSSAMLAAEGDPWFQVGSNYYRFLRQGGPTTCAMVGGYYCVEVLNPISTALQYMKDNVLTPTDRILHIEEDTYSETVWVYGTDPGVKGLIGIQGEGNPDNVVINGNLYIGDFTTGFSVSNLTVSNFADYDDAAIWTWNNNGTLKLTDVTAQATEEDSTGIIIYHSGTVELNRVNASGNAYVGAYIENYTTGAIKITNSTFDNNLQNVNDGNKVFDCNDWDEFGDCIDWEPEFSGLNIGWSAGPVTLFGVSVSDNLGDGANIYSNNNTVTVKNSVFDRNDESSVVDYWGDGLYIYSNTTTLENIQANDNDLRGIFAYANTSFTSTHLHTDGNDWHGVAVETCEEWGDADSFCDNSGAGTVTIKDSSGTYSGDNGYDIYAKGTVTLSNIFTGWNGSDGVTVNNMDSPGAPVVNITGVEVQDSVIGISLYLKSPATLKDVSLHDNSSDGLHIESIGTGAITITNASNTFNETARNGANGYYIDTMGPVTVTNLDTYENGAMGGYINNSGAASAAAVTINMLATTDYINGYMGNGAGGLQVFSRGAVTISRVMIRDNGGYGAQIYNVPTGALAGVPVTVSDSSFDGSTFGYDGLNIVSKGLITLSNIRANYNGGYGVFLDNKSTGGTAGVTINAGTGKGNEFQGNRLSGLVIRTNGPATLTNLYTSNNGWNTYESLGDFTITTYLSFEPESNYQLSGLVLYQDKGNFLQLGRAYCNAVDCVGNGIYFDSVVDTVRVGSNYATVIASPSVVYLKLERNGNTLTGYYSADGSTWTFLGSHALAAGFQINGFGLTASQDLYNPNPQIPSDFEFFGIENPSWVDGFSGYLEDGWVWVNENSEYWNLTENPGYLRIYNNNGQTGSQNMLLRTVGVGHGVDIEAKGVTIKQVGAWGVQDAWAEGNVFSNNNKDGLHIFSNAAATVAFFQARNNGQDGMYIDASAGSGAVSVTGTSNNWQNLAFNGNDGMEVNARGNITLSKAQVFGNGHNGAMLMNNGGTGNVTLTDAWFDNNGWYGLNISTKGAVSWKNGSANNNFQNGAYIFNGGVAKAVTINNVYTSNNGETGIYVQSKGAVTMTEVESNNNSANYYVIHYGEWWTDNLSDDQVWYFYGNPGEHAIIEVSSERFNPDVFILDPNGGWVDNFHGLDGSAYYDFILSEEGFYELHVSAQPNDCGQCWSYDIKVYSYTVEGALAVTNQSLANGIYVDNSQGTGTVTITNASNRWFGNNSGTGVGIYSSGAVSLKGMDLNDSGQGGTYINNIPATGTGAPGVTLTSVNFYNNDLTSAHIMTRGPVTVTSSDQSGNWSYGFWVDNTAGTALSPITFTNVSLSNYGTADTGIYLRSDGAVTMTNVFSNGNVDAGIDIDTDGAVKFNLVVANVNDGYGAHVITPGSFTLISPTTDHSRFNRNSGTGLYVQAGGTISINTLHTLNNGNRFGNGDPDTYAHGVYLSSTNALGTAPITLTNTTSNNNTLDGVYIDTLGAVTVNTLNLNDNTAYGLYLDQVDALDSTKPIILNLVTANNNGWDPVTPYDGLYITTKGSITVNTLSTMNNAASGAVLYNRNTGATGTITLLNTLGYKSNMALFNGGVGLGIYSNGAVSISQLESLHNGADGLYIRNINDTLKPVVNLSNVISRFNTVGLYVESSGVVTVNTSWAIDNDQDGISVHTNNNVNILNTASLMNGWSGVFVENSVGTWTLKLTGSAWFGNNQASLGYPNLGWLGNWAFLY